MNKLIAGTDEAGRGSILGPLVVSCVVANNNTIKQFSRIGVKDSKKLSSKKREIFAKIILKNAEKVYIRKISIRKIDKAVNLRRDYILKKIIPKTYDIVGLNELEARSMASIINKLNTKIVYVDSCDVNPNRFKKRILNQINNKISIRAQHKADEKYVIVAAASIIAKYIRDKEIKKIETLYGNIGSGYPSDPTTRLFLQRWLLKNGEIPNYARKSWKTWIKLQPK